MDRSDFQNACEGYIDEAEFLRFEDVLDIAHQAMLELNPEIKQMQEASEEMLGDVIHWLELLCWVEMEQDSIIFHGIKPCGFNLNTAETMDQIPTIQLEGNTGDFSEQTFNWDGIQSIIRQYGVELGGNACAPPFLSVWIDDTRTNSAYYRLTKYDYDNFELTV